MVIDSARGNEVTLCVGQAERWMGRVMLDSRQIWNGSRREDRKVVAVGDSVAGVWELPILTGRRTGKAAGSRYERHKSV